MCCSLFSSKENLLFYEIIPVMAALTAYRSGGNGNKTLQKSGCCLFVFHPPLRVNYINRCQHYHLVVPPCRQRHPQSRLILFCVKYMLCSLIGSSQRDKYRSGLLPTTVYLAVCACLCNCLVTVGDKSSLNHRFFLSSQFEN